MTHAGGRLSGVISTHPILTVAKFAWRAIPISASDTDRVSLRRDDLPDRDKHPSDTRSGAAACYTTYICFFHLQMPTFLIELVNTTFHLTGFSLT